MTLFRLVINRITASVLALITMLMVATLLSALTFAAVLLGEINPSYNQLLYISQAQITTDNRVTLYIHDLRADIRLPIVEDYLGWGSDAAWSPDGKSIAYSVFEEGEIRRNIYIVDVTTRNSRRITGNTIVTDHNSPTWSPDGRYIAYHAVTPDAGGDLDLYLYDLQEDEQHLIYSNPGQDFVPAWSPAGGYIAFERQSPSRGQTSLYILDLSTSKAAPLNDSTAYNVAPAWSPDGTQIAFASQPVPYEGYKIYVINADGTGLELIPTDHPSYLRETSWSPDGHYLAYTHFGNDAYRIYITRADGSGQPRAITPADEWYRQPAWRP